jgi:chromosome transmission fidelity protein 1
MDFLDAQAPAGGAAAGGLSPGRALYEGLCLKTVNQSIGRAIRHARDHAVVLLMDTRYAAERMRAGLPRWIAPRVAVCDSFAPVMAGVAAFFRGRRAPAASS